MLGIFIIVPAAAAAAPHPHPSTGTHQHVLSVHSPDVCSAILLCPTLVYTPSHRVLPYNPLPVGRSLHVPQVWGEGYQRPAGNLKLRRRNDTLVGITGLWL